MLFDCIGHGLLVSWPTRSQGRYPPLVAKHLISRRHYVLTSLKELHGMNLACWCPPSQPCHADVLLRLANAPTKSINAETINEVPT